MRVSKDKIKGYDSPLTVVFLMIICFPVGVYALWITPRIPRTVKLLVTILLGILMLYLLPYV